MFTSTVTLMSSSVCSVQRGGTMHRDHGPRLLHQDPCVASIETNALPPDLQDAPRNGNALPHNGRALQPDLYFAPGNSNTLLSYRSTFPPDPGIVPSNRNSNPINGNALPHD